MKLTRPLAVSMLLNVALLGLAGYGLAWKVPHLDIPRPADGDGIDPSKIAQPLPTPAQFQWSQVESPNYARYVANLQAIGCPEKTIRDIVSAELAEVFAQERSALVAQESQQLSDAALASTQTPPVRQKLQDLEQEQQGFLASLLPAEATHRSIGATQRASDSLVPPPDREVLAPEANSRIAGPMPGHQPVAAATSPTVSTEPQNSVAASASAPVLQTSSGRTNPIGTVPADAPRQRPARRDLFTVEEQRYRALWGWGGFYYEPASAQ